MFGKKKQPTEEQIQNEISVKKPKFSLLRWKDMKQATPEDEARFREQMQENKVGFKDGLAMTLAAFLVIVLPTLLILAGTCLLVMLLFGVL